MVDVLCQTISSSQHITWGLLNTERSNNADFPNLMSRSREDDGGCLPSQNSDMPHLFVTNATERRSPLFSCAREAWIRLCVYDYPRLAHWVKGSMLMMDSLLRWEHYRWFSTQHSSESFINFHRTKYVYSLIVPTALFGNKLQWCLHPPPMVQWANGYESWMTSCTWS